jgi:large subunit ribosomal protein L18
MIARKRRIEGVTDYKARANLLKGNIPRLVIRVSNRYVLVQYVKSVSSQDYIISGSNSKELAEFGWKKIGSLKSISAAYLTGYLAVKKVHDKENEAKAILDLGLKRSSKGSRIFSALKGAIDAGLKISCDKEMLPDEARIKKEADVDAIKEKINKKFV